MFGTKKRHRRRKKGYSIFSTTKKKKKSQIFTSTSHKKRRKHISNISDVVTGEDYESYISSKLESCGYTQIKLTPGSGDQGIDILARREGALYGFQCKYYTKPVGNKAVQEAYAGKTYYRCEKVVVITNSYFTDAAKKLASTTGVLLWENSYIERAPVYAGRSFASTENSSPIEKRKKHPSIIGRIIGLFWLITPFALYKDIPAYFLAHLFLVLVFIGGMFGVFEMGRWWQPLVSLVMYSGAMLVVLYISGFPSFSDETSLYMILGLPISNSLYRFWYLRSFEENENRKKKIELDKEQE